MTDLDQIARRAGTELRRWAPAGPDDAPAAAMASRVRRSRTGRSVAGVAAAALVVVAGIGLARGDDRPDSMVIPADGGRPAPTTTELAPSTTTSEVDPMAPPSAPIVEPPAGPGADVLGACSGSLVWGPTYSVQIPAGWQTNEGPDPHPSCTHFAPAPVEFTDYDEVNGYASNSVVLFEPHAPGSVRWEDQLAAAETAEYGPGNPSGLERLAAERVTTSRGDVAFREEFRSPDGHWVRWLLPVGTGHAYAFGYERPGTSFAEAAAAVDLLVESLRVQG